MPAARLIHEPNPTRLLERATAGLFPLSAPTDARPWPTLDAWLVLRQGGLRDDVHRLAARAGVAGWFDPSICLFTELNAQWGTDSDDAASPLTEPERHAIIARLLDQHGSALFGRNAALDAWVPAVDSFLGELASEGISPDALAAALRHMKGDAYAQERARTLTKIHASWHEVLGSAGRRDGRDAKIRLAESITADPDGFAERLGGRRDIRIVGLADLRGGWRPLLAALAASPALDRLDIFTSAELDLPASFTVERAGDVDAPAPSAKRMLWESPDSAREAERVAVRVRELIDAGAEPTRIAVIARQARPAVETMATALEQIGVPVSARRRHALGETAPARALFAILNAAREQWSRHSIAELADHPLLKTGLDASLINVVGYAGALDSRDGWRDALRDLVQRAEERELNLRAGGNGDDRREKLPPASRVKATLAAWEALEPQFARLDGSHSLAAWCQWTRDTLGDPSWGIRAALDSPCVDAFTWRTDVRAHEEIDAIADAWQRALATFAADSASMDATRFLDRLTLMLDDDIITQPETDFGVVVAEALAAGWRAFDHVFIIGLSAGAFPHRPSPGQLFDAEERAALIAAGLPLDAPDAWRTRERELFRVLTAGARESLTLSWPAMDPEGRDVARSAFVDEAAATLARESGIEDDDPSDDALEKAGVLVRFATEESLVPGFPVADSAHALAHARAAFDRESQRTDDPDAWNGRIEDAALGAWLAKRYDESYQWSATQLEEAAKCRWHWFAHRLLALETRTDADDLLEPTVSGSLRHDALDRFFERARAERTAGRPVLLMKSDESWAMTDMARALDDAWAAAGEAGEWLGPAMIQSAARAELLRELQGYLAWEIEFNMGFSDNRKNASKVIRSGAAEGEYAFDDVEIAGGGVTFRLRGSIDRVDVGVDERIEGAERYIAAIDYKSSIYATPAGGKSKAWGDGIVLQVPLYAAALEKLRPDSIVARMEYRTLRNPKPVHVLSLHPMRKGELQDAPDARQMLDDALDAAGRLITDLRGGVLPARPAPSAGCSPYCPARDICRIPGGPREAE